MKRIVRFFMTVFVSSLLSITVACVFAAQAAPDWHSLGLSDRAVNCVLADDTSMILAGTDSGVSVRWNNTWYHIKMLPVKALVRISSGVVAAAAGDGSKSDGVYLGKSIINGPPFFLFTISNGNWIMQPTALLASSALSASDPAVMHLYVGNGNSVVTGVVKNDSLSELDPIGTPDFAFGMEQPYCAALHLFGNRLYAGGYDRSPMAGLSYLEYMYGDSMYSMRTMKTSAIAEGRFPSIFGSTSLSVSSVMAVADVDSGVFFYDPSLGNPWHRMAGPTSNPIVSLYAGKRFGANGDTVLYAANKDGVFQGASAEPQPIWVKIGTLPVKPLYITGMGSTGDLLAATVNGVYRYGNQVTGVRRASGSTARTNAHGKKISCVSGKTSPCMEKALFDLQGRSIVTKAPIGAKASGVVVTDIR